MFDISAIDTKTPCETPVFMAMLDPVTGQKLLDSEGKEVGANLLGRFSDAFVAARKANQDRRLAAAAAKNDPPTEEEEVANLVAACTTGWTWTELDGKPFPYTPENAKKFWSDRRFKLHTDFALGFISDLGNFTKR